MSRRGVLLVGRPVTDDAVDNDQGRTIVASLKSFKRFGELVPIVCVAHMQNVPVVAFEAGCDILAESKLRVSLNRDGVVVVDPTQIRETEMAGEGSCFARHAFHHVAVAADDVDGIVEQREVGPVVACGEPARRDRHADAVSATLAQRSGRGFDAGGQAVLGMAWRDAADLAEALNVVESDRRLFGDSNFIRNSIRATHARKVQQAVKQQGGVAGREHEAIAIGPKGIGRIVAEEVLP